MASTKAAFGTTVNRYGAKLVKSGDRNASFFYRKITTHTARNRIMMLQDAEGVKITDYEQVKQIAVNFYQDLFGKKVESRSDMGFKIKEVVKKALTQKQRKLLITEISSDEIKKVLFSMEKGKAPGPDGYSVEFFKSNWQW